MDEDKSGLAGLLGFAVGYKAVAGEDASVGGALQGLFWLWAVGAWLVLVFTEPAWTILITLLVIMGIGHFRQRAQNAENQRTASENAQYNTLVAGGGEWHLNPDGTYSLWRNGRLVVVTSDPPENDVVRRQR